jgi:hypothetical protein
MSNTTEVKVRATRRRFLGKEKLEILALTDACTGSGELSALMGVADVFITFVGPNTKRRGPTAKVVDPRDAQIARLERFLRRSEWVCEQKPV